VKRKKEYDGKRHAHEYHKKQSNVIMHSLVKDMSKKDILLYKYQRLDSCGSVHDKIYQCAAVLVVKMSSLLC